MTRMQLSPFRGQGGDRRQTRLAPDGPDSHGLHSYVYLVMRSIPVLQFSGLVCLVYRLAGGVGKYNSCEGGLADG